MKQNNSNSIKKNKINSLENTLPFYLKFAPQLLFALAFFLYLPTIYQDYCFDDALVITENKFTQEGLSGIPKLISTDFFAGSNDGNAMNLTGGRYRPLSLVMFAIEYHFFGLNPMVGHFLNVLFYALTALLFYRLLSSLFPQNLPLAFLSVLFFVVHPIHTEVVANIKSRDEIMALFFLLVSLLQFNKFLLAKTYQNLIFACLTFLFAMFSKESAFTFVVLIPLCFWFFKNATKSELLKISLGVGLMAVSYLLIRSVFVGNGSEIVQSDLLENPLYGTTFSQHLGTVAIIVLHYWKLLLFPFPLSCDYSYNQIPITELTSLWAIVSIVFHLFLATIIVWKWKQKNIVIWCLLVIIAPLSLAINLFFNIGAPMGERFLYLSSIGFCILIAILFGKLIQNKKLALIFTKPIQTLVIIFIVVLASSWTFQRNKAWFNNETLFATDVKTVTKSAKIHYYYANSLLSKYISLTVEEQQIKYQQLIPEALKEFKKAVEIYPNFHTGWYNVGLTYYQMANYQAATNKIGKNYAIKSEKALKKSLELVPKHIFSMDLLAELYSRHLNLPKLSVYYCEKLIKEANYGKANVYSTLGIAQFMLGKIDLAISSLEKAIQLEGTNKQYWQNLAAIYANTGNLAKANECMKTAENLN